MNYLLIKTADMHAHISIVDEKNQVIAHDDWEAGRQLSKDLLSHLDQLLLAAGINWSDLSGIGVFRGPGSFTSLRIGLTTANTIAYSENIAIVGTAGEAWSQEAIDRLTVGESDRQVMPDYGADPHITAPRK